MEPFLEKFWTLDFLKKSVDADPNEFFYGFVGESMANLLRKPKNAFLVEFFKKSGGSLKGNSEERSKGFLKQSMEDVLEKL